MKLKSCLIISLIFTIVVLNLAYSQFSSGVHFTTDVEAIDLDDDGDKDLVFSVYRHPYFEGDGWVAGENGIKYMLNLGGGNYTSPPNDLITWGTEMGESIVSISGEWEVIYISPLERLILKV